MPPRYTIPDYLRSNGSTTPTVAENWSGYAVTGKKQYTYVHSTFVQPTITCTGVADQYVSEWAGLDGFNNETVEQDGTDAWCAGAAHTTPKYEAWYEMYPANSVNTFAVHPGDVIDVSVSYSDSTSDFSLTVSDLSTGKTATDFGGVLELRAGIGGVDHRAASPV